MVESNEADDISGKINQFYSKTFIVHVKVAARAVDIRDGAGKVLRRSHFT